MELAQRLDDYEVTRIPGQARLRLVWSAPVDVDVDEAPSGTANDADGVATLILLAPYRITRVPRGVAYA